MSVNAVILGCFVCVEKPSDRARRRFGKTRVIRQDRIINKGNKWRFLTDFRVEFQRYWRRQRPATTNSFESEELSTSVSNMCVPYRITDLHSQLQATNLGKPRALSWIYVYQYCLRFGISKLGFYWPMNHVGICNMMLSIHAFLQLLLKLQTLKIIIVRKWRCKLGK